MKKHLTNLIKTNPNIRHFFAILSSMIILFISFFLISCSDEFPEESKETLYLMDKKYHFALGSMSGEITYEFDNNASNQFEVYMYPKWMDLKIKKGNLQSGKAVIPFEFKNPNEFMVNGRAIGRFIIKIASVGYFEIEIIYGQPVTNPGNDDDSYGLAILCDKAEINFDSNEIQKFTIINVLNREVWWTARDIPSWLVLSQTSGYIEAGGITVISCHINYEGLIPGRYSQIININVANPPNSAGILFNLNYNHPDPPSDSPNLKWISGDISDALFCQSSGNLYILTQNPNRVLIKSDATDTLQSISLSRIPNCIDVSKDGKTIAIGYNQANVDIFDGETFNIKRSYETKCIPHDIVLGENGWCYLAPALDQGVYFYSLNLSTGETFHTSTKNPVYEKSVMFKDPEKPILYMTRPRLSPGGILIIDISKGAANDTIPYWHVDTGGKLWLTEDGNKLIASYKKIYKKPDYTTENLHQIDLDILGTVNMPQNQIQSLYYSKTRKSYFVSGSDYFWTAYNASIIYQLDPVSFSSVNSFTIKPYPGYYKGTMNQPMNIHHLFVNNDGNKIYALKCLYLNSQTENWALEIIDL